MRFSADELNAKKPRSQGKAAKGQESCWIFFLACFGFAAALSLSIVPLALGIVSFALILIAGWAGKTGGMEDTHVLASIFITLMGVVGGIVLFAASQGWPLFVKTGGT